MQAGVSGLSRIGGFGQPAKSPVLVQRMDEAVSGGCIRDLP